MTETTLLRMDEAVDLGHAWVQTIAEERGIRTLIIKGPALHRHGLRNKRYSGDIDVLVEPARFVEFCDAMRATGWRDRDTILISERTTLHSKNFLRDGWPCDLDVHSFFPGFLADPTTVFDALWERHVTMPFAHRDCAVPDRVSGVLILALHSLRGSVTQARHANELEQLVHVPLTAEEKSDAAALALATGSAATLETVLPRMGVEVQAPAAELESRELREWRERVASGSHGAYFWFVAFRRASWRDRPMIVWQAFWPSRHDLLIARPETVDTLRGRTRARVARWGRGIRSLPSALRAILTHLR
ncbi:nucleotidyltransferase family protein [Microbacterium sp. C7(2022)]|uniref:nucleotidyltransferase family protein n=1 Tax=Microbacterium sp. C7(2022) TaxID=2992759 RepID=UPI00237B006F|nr:nucleotidyltransferase family protein [Microbacterium sp. C7(2022)]MDE0545359.1 nucleotidyltransferase family protein [Microbacterium sp. C7(2022)]